MRRIVALAVVGFVACASQANAQIIGPTIIGPFAPQTGYYGGGYYGGGYNGLGYNGFGNNGLHSLLAERELNRRLLHASAHARGISPQQHTALHRALDRDRARDAALHDQLHSPQPVFLPPVTRSSNNPFAGNPNGGNYYYWLSQEYARGRISKSEYNRLFYGIGRK